MLKNNYGVCLNQTRSLFETNFVTNYLGRDKCGLWSENKAGVWAVSPSSEQIELFWVVCFYKGGRGAMPLVEKWWFESMNKYLSIETNLSFSFEKHGWVCNKHYWYCLNWPKITIIYARYIIKVEIT